MKIVFPVEENKGLESLVFAHFGSAPLFISVNTEDNSFESLKNKDLNHSHGQCNPMAALGGVKIDAVAAGGIGGGALMKLQKSGVKVYRAAEGSIKENLELIASGKMPEFAINQTCAGHGSGSLCDHHHAGGKLG